VIGKGGRGRIVVDREVFATHGDYEDSHEQVSHSEKEVIFDRSERLFIAG
jgi:hypothetical protein